MHRCEKVKCSIEGVLRGDRHGEIVTLAYDGRHRRRCRLTTDQGRAFLLDLPDAVELRDGDTLVLDDGSHVAIRAAIEPLMEARVCDPLHLARLAWHVGNRHLAAEIHSDRLVLRRDHVIADMLERLGAEVAEIEAPFNPESGAYGHGRTHGHAHGHPHG